MLACYIKRHDSARFWQPLEIGTTVPIGTGDICSILPNRDESWFAITFGDSSTKMEHDRGKRRTAIPSTDEPPDKKPRTSDTAETIYARSKVPADIQDTENTSNGEASREHTSQSVQSKTIFKETDGGGKITGSDVNGNKPVRDIWVNPDRGEAHTGENLINVPEGNSSTRATPATGHADLSSLEEAQSQNRDEAGKKIKWDCARHFSDQPDQGSSEKPADEKTDDSSTGQENNPTAETNVSSDEPPRNKCAYGSQCYRRNSSHKAEFSHPGDPDYDIPDTRPECPYGVRCYRKNPEHKRDYKHTRVRSLRAQTPVRGRASDATSGTEQSSAEESVDESEYEPSCGGATSDEYRSDLDGFSDFEAASDPEDDK